MSLNIKSKLLIFTLCISLIPIATITVVYYINARNIIKQHELNDLTAIAESEKGHVITFLESKKARTLDFSTDGFIRDSLDTINRGDFLAKNEATIALNSHLLMNKKPLDPHITAIDVADQYGKIVASSNEKLIGRDVSNHEAFAKARNKIYDGQRG